MPLTVPRGSSSFLTDLSAADRAPGRTRAEVHGVVVTVLIQPAGSSPVFEADVKDAAGVLTVRWMGRWMVLGIAPGAKVRVSGLITERGRRRVMYNPRYEIIATRDEE